MGKRKRKTSQKNAYVLLWLMIVSGLIVVYFYGTVHLTFVMQDNDALKIRRQVLQQQVDKLDVRISQLRSYQRIVQLAHQQGLVFLTATDIEDLPVDLDGIQQTESGDRPYLRIAGFFSLPRLKRQFSQRELQGRSNVEVE